MIYPDGTDTNAVIKGYIGASVIAAVAIVIGCIGFAIGHPAANVAGIAFFILAIYLVVSVVLERAHVQRKEMEQERRKTTIEEAQAERTLALAALIQAKANDRQAQVDDRNKPLTFARIPPPPDPEPLPAIYVNGKPIDHVDHDEELAEPSWMQSVPPEARDIEPTPEPTTRRDILASESQADHALRIRTLAATIDNQCHDRNPSQANIRQVIQMTQGGLLRSNGDITEALDYLARVGEVTPSQGAGIKRLWLDRVTHAPIDHKR